MLSAPSSQHRGNCLQDHNHVKSVRPICLQNRPPNLDWALGREACWRRASEWATGSPLMHRIAKVDEEEMSGESHGLHRAQGCAVMAAGRCLAKHKPLLHPARLANEPSQSPSASGSPIPPSTAISITFSPYTVCSSLGSTRGGSDASGDEGADVRQSQSTLNSPPQMTPCAALPSILLVKVLCTPRMHPPRTLPEREAPPSILISTMHTLMPY